MNAKKLAVTLCAALAVPALAKDGRSDAATKTPIKHLVVIFQENETFDHYFGTYPNAANFAGEPVFIARPGTPAVNGLSQGLISGDQNKAQPFRLGRDQAFTCSQNHGYTAEQKAVNSGLLDKFVEFTSGKSVGCEPDGTTVMGFYDGNTVTALWQYAQHFALSDNSFGTTFGPSTPGALNLVSGQTHGASYFAVTPTSRTPVTVSDGSVFFGPGDAQGTVISDPDPFLDDCGADKGGTGTAKTVRMNGKNVGDLLNAKGITWGWFQGGFAPTQPATFNADGSLKTPAVCGQSHAGHPGVANPAGDTNPSNADIHGPVTDYSAHHSAFQYYASTANPHHLRPTGRIGTTDQANHNYDLADFFAALGANGLPAVSYLKAASFQDGHPGNSDPLSEQTFLVQVINALQASPDWESTAVVIAWDDSDGWFDHVTGPIVNPSAGSVDAFAAGINCGTPAPGAFQGRCGYGPRLPLLAVSPFAKENHVDHNVTDQSSLLRFVEDNWFVGQIDGPAAPPKGQSSFDRLAGSIEGMFDFAHPRNRTLVLDASTGLPLRQDGDEHAQR
ncbi:MAG TPA: alkaline phosphatase family protein [Myxococcales bacterium]